MKFTCERCGKKYATAEDPAPGRVYKLKCKACGHLIVVKASAGAPSSDGPLANEPQGVPEAHPAATPEIQLEVAPPEPAAPFPDPGTPPPLDATTEVSMAGLSVDPPPWPNAPAPLAPWDAPAPEAPPPASAPEGYVDLFGEGAKAAEKPPKDDPFLAAARASLPDGYGEGNPAAPDPFGGLREELAADLPQQKEPTPYRSTTRVPAIPKPVQQKSAMPLVLIGAGALVLVGILGFVLLGGKKAEPPARPAARAEAPTPPAPPPQAPPAQETPPQAVEPATPPPAQPQAAATPPPKPADDAKRAAEERRRREREEAREREAQARADREARDRAAREARERDRLEREQRAREAQERARREAQQREAERVAAANIPVAETGLSQAQIEKVLLATKRAFDACIEEAKGAGMKLDGRRVLLRLNIQTSGAVTYPTLDDVTLNSTDLGGCLKSAARLMVFPKFKGDTMHVEVPLVLR